jgi:hypothetical protein
MKPSLRWTQTDLDWVRPFYEAAARLNPRDFVEKSVQGLRMQFDQGHRDVLVARGNIFPHTDSEFEPWAYVLVLRANAPTLKVHAQPPLVLRQGMLVEFTAHRRHSLQQGRNDLLVWLPWDDHEQATWKHALACLERPNRLYQVY